MKKTLSILYLASQSPRRREILTQMKIPFVVVPSSYRERLRQNIQPEYLALEHAEGKVLRAQTPPRARFVLGADTVVACAGKILGKPKNEKEALAMIRFLSGRQNDVVTGIALMDLQTGILTRASAHSRVLIKKMKLSECLEYVRQSHPYDKAGGYAIQGKPKIAARVRGSYSNIVGFPRELVSRLLKQAGFFAAALLCLCLWYGSFGMAAESEKVRSAHTEASLVSEYDSFQSGTPIRIALRLRMDQGWHTYWANSGDSGLPTTIQWTLPEGYSVGAIEWPYPELIRQGPLATYGYHGEVWLFTTIQTPAIDVVGQEVIIDAKADWLECEVPCLPGRAKLSLGIKTGSESIPSSAWKNGADFFLKKLPEPSPPGQFSFTQNKQRVTLKSLLPSKDSFFFPYDGELFEHAEPQNLSRLPQGFSLEIKRSALNPERVLTLAGVLVLYGGKETRAYEVHLSEGESSLTATTAEEVSGASKDPSADLQALNEPLSKGLAAEAEQAIFPSSTQNSGEPQTLRLFDPESQKPISLWIALAFAFMGGMILNLMPCVLPVLSLKILGFVSQRGETKKLRSHALIWTLGVLVSFWTLSIMMLALRWGGSSLGWGFHLQSPGMVAALAVIFLLLTLNMAGFFEVGLLLTRYAPAGGNPDEKNAQAFWAGVLAVVAATPCTAPFMGAAVGYSLAQPTLVVLAIFSFLGLGMAFPFLFLAFLPGGLKFLPKPGPWMNRFKKVLAIPLGLTVLWLLWVLASQISVWVLLQTAAVLLMTGLGAIFYGKVQSDAVSGSGHSRHKSRWILILITLSALATVLLAARPSDSEVRSSLTSKIPATEPGVQWKAFSQDEITELVRLKQPVFIDFTARWCLSCQVNDRLIFRTEEVGALFKSRGIHAFKADWTSRDDAITAALAAYGRASVPLYVYYDGKNPMPRFLPEILTVSLVEKAIEES